MDYEDTVLRNSPLDVYLQQVSEMEFSKYKSLDESYEETYENDRQTDVNNGSGSLTFLCSNDYILKDDILKCLFVCFECISLNEKDRHILIEVEENVHKLLVTMEHDNKTHGETPVLNFKYFVAAFLVAIAAFLLPWLYFSSRFEEVFLFMLFIICCCSYLCFTPPQSNVARSLMDELISFNQITARFEQTVDKTVQHLKEVEIVTNGYIRTLSSSESNKRVDRGVKCKKLRQFIFDGLVKLFMIVRSRQRILLQRKSSLAKDEYLAEMSLDMFTDILQESQSEAGVVTLQRIKGIVCLYREQFSEFIYSCILILHTLENNDISSVKDILFACSDITKNVAAMFEELESQLNASIHMIFNQSEVPVINKSISNNDTSTLFHSTKLHLHSALHRLDDMMQLYEKLNDDNAELFGAAVNQMYLLLQNTKYNIDDIVDASKVGKKTDESAFQGDEELKVDNECVENVTLYQEPKCEVGDILLEAESDGGKLHNSTADLSCDDLQTAMKDHRNSKKLMRELKCVLSVKASPEGLISFPIHSPLTDGNVSCENSSEEEGEVKKSKHVQYDATEYYNSIDESNSKVNFSLPSPTLDNLSTDTNNFMNEETFGETDHEDSDEKCTANGE